MAYSLIIQPIYDDATEIQAEYLKSLEPKLKEINPNVIFEYGDIDEKDVEYWIAEYNPKFIYFGGHGLPDGIVGSKNYIIRFGYNDFILKGRGIYLFECDSAVTLGKFTSAEAVIGYVKPYYVYQSLSLALGFLPLIYILSGYTFRDTYNLTKRYYKEYIPKATGLEKEVLEHNYKALTLYGNKYFKI